MEQLSALQQMEIDELEELYSLLGIDEAGGIEIDDLTEEEHEAVNQRFKVESLDQLNWVFRKLDAYAVKLDAVKALADKERQRINEWEEKESAGLKSSILFFERLANDYANRCREIDPKYKGEKTPYGGISFKKQQTEWTYPNESETVKFLQAAGLVEHVKVTESIANKTAIKKALEIRHNVYVQNGEVVDVATEGSEGMQYKMKWIDVPATDETPAHVSYIIIDMTTGEIAYDVQFMDQVVTYGSKVVPGVVAMDRPDKIEIKRSAK